jgi:phage tail-like protein
MLFSTTNLPLTTDPPLGFRFLVVFLMRGTIPNPIDIRFQSVSGLSAELVVEDLGKSSSISVGKKVVTQVNYDRLVLERGVLVASPLSMTIEKAFKDMKIHPCDVIVSVLNELFLPAKVWKFTKAFPVKWSISGIDATKNEVLVEKIELEYEHFATFSL